MTKRYATVVADPPWRYNVAGRKNAWGTPTSAAGHYPTMSDEQIRELPVARLAATNAHLYLWVTNTRLFECRAIEIVESWGFAYKTMLTWIKSGQPGLGSYFRGCTEHVLFCARGDAPIPAERRERNHFATLRTPHSQKPDAFYDLVERVSPSPRLELFARRQRLGWDTWGNESLEHVELAS